MKKLISLFVTAITLVSCGSGNGDIQYIPFQSTEDGNWGMVSPEGEVLFSDEFKECPTLAVNDRFFAKSSDGNYEMYSTNKKPQTVGKQVYSQVGIFLDDVVPVVRPNMPIEFIDKSGEVKLILKTFEGKSVESCTNFYDGVSIVTAEGLCGVVNTFGKTVVMPEYDEIGQPSDGKMIATKKKGDKLKFYVFSTSGEVLSTFTSDKFEEVGSQFSDGVTFAKVDKGSTSCCGLINEKGEWVLKPVTKVKDIYVIENGTFTYSDGANVGVMDTQGNVVLRAKYSSLFYADDSGKLFFAKQDEKDAQWKLIDADGNAVGSDEYEYALPFIGDRAFVQVSKNEMAIINKKGEEQKVKVDIVDISVNTGSDVFYSEYVDANTIVAQLKLEEHSMGGISLDMKPEQVADIIKQKSPNGKLCSKGFGSIMELPISVGGEDNVQRIYFESVAFDDFNADSFTFYDTPITHIENNLEFSGKYKDHLRDIFEAVKEKVKTFGSVEEETDNGIVIMLNKQDDGKDYQLVYLVEIIDDHLLINLGWYDRIGTLGSRSMTDSYGNTGNTQSDEYSSDDWEAEMVKQAESENQALDKWLAKHPEYADLDPCDQIRMCHEDTGFDFDISAKACR